MAHKAEQVNEICHESALSILHALELILVHGSDWRPEIAVC